MQNSENEIDNLKPENNEVIINPDVVLTENNTEKTLEVVENKTSENVQINVNPFTKPENHKAIEGFSFWLKFQAVLIYISVPFLVIMIFTIPLAIFMVLSGVKLWKASENIDDINLNKSNNDEQVTELAFSAIKNVKSYFKTYILSNLIFTIVFVAIYIIFLVVFLLSGGISSVLDNDYTF